MYLDGFVEYSNRTFFKHEEPQRYMYNRGLNKEDIENYTIGYTKFAKIKKTKDIDYKMLLDSTYNFKMLENRIIIPLRNLIGNVNGLVVRSIKEKRYNLYLMEEAKKIGHFFGLFEVLNVILDKNIVFVHESAIDSISFSKVFQNSISTLTSFINDQQYEILTMLVDKIVLVFDPDKPGRTGQRELFKRYGRKHLDSIFIGYSDSNNCLRIGGLKNFQSYIRSKVPVLLQ